MPTLSWVNSCKYRLIRSPTVIFLGVSPNRRLFISDTVCIAHSRVSARVANVFVTFLPFNRTGAVYL